MMRSRWYWLLLGIMGGIILFALFISIYMRVAGGRAVPSFIASDKGKLSLVLDLVEREYVDSLGWDTIQEHAVTALMQHLDPHSEYISAEDFKELNAPLQGDFEGVGITFNMLTDTIVVLSVIPNGPSERAGVMPGDMIITVDGDTVAGRQIRQDSLVKRLRGPRGSKVVIGVARGEEKGLTELAITRNKIPIKSVEVAYMLDEATGYIALSRFSQTTPMEFAQAAERLLAQGMQALILDLRGNGGGLLDAACFISELLLPKDRLIVYTEGLHRERRDIRSRQDGPLRNIGLAILIDEASASASEIVAGAVQDNDRGFVVGRRSFGKGLVQEQFTFSDSSALRLTVARYHTPSGRCIQRPYQLGNDSLYYQDMFDRFERGELMVADSVRQDTLLRYITQGGRTVYGGGGIMPDVFVGADTTGTSVYFRAMRRRFVFDRFALHYLRKHRAEMQNLAGPKALEVYLDERHALRSLTDYATTMGIRYNAKDFATSRHIIRAQVYSLIARGLWDNEGLYPMLEGVDTTLKVARQTLKSKTVL